MLKVAEIFSSYQGEGELSGQPATFIRLSGCNLRCWFCDTPYTSWKPEGEHLELFSIIQLTKLHAPKNIVITGGEPLLQPEVVPLTNMLKNEGFHITIETAGTIDRPVQCDLMSISPKRSNSTPQTPEHWRERHEADRHQPAVISRFIDAYRSQFKFVIDQPADIQDVINYLEEFPGINRDRVFLMPQARSAEEILDHENWLKPLAHQHGLRVTSRLHILEFGNTRGS